MTIFLQFVVTNSTCVLQAMNNVSLHTLRESQLTATDQTFDIMDQQEKLQQHILHKTINNKNYNIEDIQEEI